MTDEHFYKIISDVATAFELNEDRYRLSRAYQKEYTLSTLVGSLVHHKIAQNENRNRPIVNQTKVIHNMSPKHKKIYNGLIVDHKNTRNKNSDLATFTKYQDMLNQIEYCYGRYTHFTLEHPHKPLAIEQHVSYKPYKLKGIADLVMVHRRRGYVDRFNLHSPFPVGTREYFIEEPTADEFHDVITLVDWKTSKKPLKRDLYQLSIYHLIWELTGEFNRLRRTRGIINSQVWSVLLGQQKAPEVYKLIKYDVDNNPLIKTGILT